MSRNQLCHGMLRQIAPFSLVSNEKLQAVYPTVRRCHYERGAIILQCRERPTGVYVLIAGRAKTVIEDAQGRAMTVSTIERNELFGGIDRFDEGVRWTGVEAREACEALHIPRAAFLECIEGNYDAAMVIVSLAESRLRAAHLKIATLGLLDVYERVARVLVESAEHIDGRWIVATGAEEIARTVAASREMVSRVVKNMNAQGLVCKDKRKTVILDWQSMQAVCRL